MSKIFEDPDCCCKFCFYWRRGARDIVDSDKIVDSEGLYGDCLIRPPSLYATPFGTVFPRTHEEDVCGRIKYA
jgi:hypothetical protein